MLLNGTLRRIRDQTVNNTLFIENEDGNANLIATVCVYVLLFNNLNEMLKDIGENVLSCVHQFSGIQKLQFFYAALHFYKVVWAWREGAPTFTIINKIVAEIAARS